MLPEANILRQIHERGFALVPNALQGASVDNLRLLLHQCVEEDLARWGNNPHYIDRWMVHNLMVRHLAFARVLENEIMHAYLSELLDNKCIVYAYTSSSMPPQGSNYSRRVHVDCPRYIPGYTSNVGIMLALNDFTAENGATYFLPAGHLRPDKPSDEEFVDKAERVYPKAGDMVVFNARTWHSGGQNMTNQARHALTLNVCRSYMRQRFDYPRMMPASILSQLNETARRFLGFNVRIPASLEEYYVPEEQRLYKANQG